jgi:hypothetical protein
LGGAADFAVTYGVRKFNDQLAVFVETFPRSSTGSGLSHLIIKAMIAITVVKSISMTAITISPEAQVIASNSRGVWSFDLLGL